MQPIPDLPVDATAGPAMGMSCVRTQWYDVWVRPGFLGSVPSPLLAMIGSRRALVVTTPTVARLYAEQLRRLVDQSAATVHVIGSGEQAKNMATVLEVCAAADGGGLRRRDLMVAFGGGICCDVVTLAASLVRRGIPYLTVPTTLVAQIDAGIGLKGGVNFEDTKNYLGCFAPPEAVVVDPRLLRTLPAVEVSCGLAEMMKIALIRDAALFADLRRHGTVFLASRLRRPHQAAGRAVVEAIALMLDELGSDCYEDGTLQRLVDFGHTFSPVLERRSGYALRHGEAVAIDMAFSCAIASSLGLLPAADSAQVLDLLIELGLPTRHPLLEPGLVRQGVEAAVAHRGGSLNLVVPTSAGTATFIEDPGGLAPSLVAAALQRLHEHAAGFGSDRVAHRSTPRARLPV